MCISAPAPAPGFINFNLPYVRFGDPRVFALLLKRNQRNFVAQFACAAIKRLKEIVFVHNNALTAKFLSVWQNNCATGSGKHG